MKRILAFLFIVTLQASAGTWSMVQVNMPARTVCDDQWSGIPTDYLTCSLSLTTSTIGPGNIGTGHQLTVLLGNNDDTPSVTPRKIALIYSCFEASAPSCTQNACTAGNAIDSWTLHHGGSDPFTANTSATVSSGGTTMVDAATIANSISGANCITVTRTDNSQNETMAFAFMEISTTVGSAHINAITTGGINSLINTTSMPTVTPTGNDALIDGETAKCDSVGAGNTTSIAAPWTGFTSAHFCWAYYPNATGSQTPVWTFSNPAMTWSAAGVIVDWAEGAAAPIGSANKGLAIHGMVLQ